MKRFILGILFGLLGIPILETLLEIVIGYLEIPKAYATKKILKENKEISKIQNVDDGETETNVMGFRYTSADEADE